MVLLKHHSILPYPYEGNCREQAFTRFDRWSLSDKAIFVWRSFFAECAERDWLIALRRPQGGMLPGLRCSKKLFSQLQLTYQRMLDSVQLW